LKQTSFIISGDPTGADLSADPDASAEPEMDESAEPESAPEQRVWSVPDTLHGQRLDRTLAELVPEFSRSYLQQLIEQGAVTSGDRVLNKPSGRVKAGDTGVVTLRPTPQSQAFKPEAMALDCVFEDEHLRVINKPAGLVVHPAPGNWGGTLLNGLLALDSGAAMLPRAGIVHRLDKDTSGLMVVARTRAVMDALVAMLAARQVSRQYVALAHKRWTGPVTREVLAPIGRDPRNRLRMAVVDLSKNAGKPSQTDISLLQNHEQACWVKCRLHSGRTHQIRVHMASIGHPLLADELYGGTPAAGLSRQALHACRLAFVHPVTQAPLLFHAPLPDDLSRALQQWGLSYNPF
jgi:23S rRNA pseudouridine1911/1915/1917 synthase